MPLENRATLQIYTKKMLAGVYTAAYSKVLIQIDGLVHNSILFYRDINRNKGFGEPDFKWYLVKLATKMDASIQTFDPDQSDSDIFSSEEIRFVVKAEVRPHVANALQGLLSTYGDDVINPNQGIWKEASVADAIKDASQRSAITG